MSVNSTNPSTLFGGTWEQLKNRFLVGAGDTYSVNATGGNTSVTSGKSSGNTGAASGNTGGTALTIDQMPNHNHAPALMVDGNKVYWGAGSGTKSLLNLESAGMAWTGNTGGSGVYTNYTGGGKEHTHTLNSHTHSLNNHTHSVATVPPYLAVYMWKRTK